MASPRTVDAYGAPQYGAIGRPPAGVCFHTPEWGSSPTLAHAIACATWQAGPTNTSGGSYHGILGHDGSDLIRTCTNPDHWVMVRSVPWNLAAGGISTKRTADVWGPQRYPWLKAMLPAAAYADPNRWLHQIALSGKAGWFVTNGYPAGMVIRLAQWVKILEGAYKYDAVMMLHRHWQVNRSDPGPLNLADLVLEAYTRLGQPAPTPAPKPTPTPTPAPPPPAPDPLAVALGRITKKDAKVKQAIALLTDALEE